MPLRPRTPLCDLVDRLFCVSIALPPLFLAALAVAPLLSSPLIRPGNDPRQHPEWMLIIVGAAFTTSIARSWLRGSIFPAHYAGELGYHESNAAGRSYRSLFTRLTGFTNGLEITVTEDELWTRLAWWYRWLYSAADFGLENRIPLGSILSVTRKGTWRWRRYYIGYRDGKGAPQQLLLKVREPYVFVAALRAGNPAIRFSDN